MPRLPLSGQRRKDVIAWVEQCAATQPSKMQAQAA
jgi:4-hydroxy-tetrahydrodipicolinate synthase